MANYLLSKLTASLNKACVRISLAQCLQEPVTKGIFFSKGWLSQKEEQDGMHSVCDSAVKVLSFVYARNIICVMKLISAYHKGCISPTDEVKQYLHHTPCKVASVKNPCTVETFPL